MCVQFSDYGCMRGVAGTVARFLRVRVVVVELHRAVAPAGEAPSRRANALANVFCAAGYQRERGFLVFTGHVFEDGAQAFPGEDVRRFQCAEFRNCGVNIYELGERAADLSAARSGCPGSIFVPGWPRTTS